MQPASLRFAKADGTMVSLRCSAGRAHRDDPRVLLRLSKPEVGERLAQLTQRLTALEGEVRRRRRAEARLEQSQAWLQGFLDHSPVAMLAVQDGETVFSNTRAAQWEASASADGAGSVPGPFDAVINAVERSKTEIEGSVSVEGRHGLATAFHTPGPSGATGVGVVCLDTTRVREAEEARADIERKMLAAQKLESLGLLAGGIAHDFNNLLVGVLGNAALARQDSPPQSPVQECLADVELAAQRAADLCRQLLAYSGKGRFIVEPLDVTELVHEMIHLVRLSVSKRAVLRPVLASGLPLVEADATQLRQVLLNLITNASDALGDEEGLITLSTSTRWLNQAQLSDLHGADLVEGQYVIVEVNDTGSGMDEETVARIFDPFFSTKFTGRGLGLAAVLGIVRGHRGAIRVYSEPGQGTLFRLVLPCASEVAMRHSAEPISESIRGTGTILVVDDEASVRSVARRTLLRAGYEVIEAEDGLRAVELFRLHQQEIDAVLLDLMMPGLSGHDVLIEIRRLAPKVRVVLSSGYNEQEVISRFAGRGLAGFLQKPWSPTDLVRMVAPPDDG